MRGRPGTKTHSMDRITAAAKRLKALDLRLAGATYDQIAEQLAYSNKGAAYKAVERGLEEAKREKADAVLEIELKRLDQMQVGVYTDARRGNRGAITTVLKIMERRAKYLSLDNPRTTDAVVEGVTLLAGIAAQLTEMPDTYEQT